LYGEKELSKFDLKSYIDELVNDIVAVSIQKEGVSLEIDTNVGNISLDTVVPLGLLINELVSNSLKHAFLEADGEVRIKIEQEGDNITFNYSDTGRWKEAEPDSISFGVELIDILTDQMNGSKELNTENGAHYVFKLKNL